MRKFFCYLFVLFGFLILFCSCQQNGQKSQVGRYKLVIAADDAERPYLVDTVKGNIWRYDPHPKSIDTWRTLRDVKQMKKYGILQDD